MSADTPGRSLGGRFAEATDPLLERVNRSVDVDKRMWPQDLRGTRAHVGMLVQVGLITADEHAAIVAGLDAVEAELRAGTFVFLPGDEDIHMAVERRLTELAGDPARKVHTGRSRNDQVMTDALLWLRDGTELLEAALAAFTRALVDRAADGVRVPMPSFTHLQPAQVSSVAQWLLAHAAEADRHRRRLVHLRERLDESPLGSGASVGGYLPLDRGLTASSLGFARPAPNAMAATGGRSDLLDALGLAAMVGVSLSRLGEELVLFASPAFGYVRFPDRLTTGSSLLPQKRNPDGAELLRASGKLPAADFAALASTTAGLVSGYSKDLQFDKELLFRSWDRIVDLLGLAERHVASMTWNADRLRAACTPDLAALWLADQLVLGGLPFRAAHHVVGRAARLAEGTTLAEGLRRALAEDPAGVADGESLVAKLGAMSPEALLEGLRTAGSAAPASTEAQIAALRARLG